MILRLGKYVSDVIKVIRNGSFSALRRLLFEVAIEFRYLLVSGLLHCAMIEHTR
jgi:hypothetical protein